MGREQMKDHFARLRSGKSSQETEERKATVGKAVQVKPSLGKVIHSKPVQGKQAEPKATHGKSRHERPVRGKTEQGKQDRGGSEHGGHGRGRSARGRPEYGKPEHGKQGRGRSGHAKPGYGNRMGKPRGELRIASGEVQKNAKGFAFLLQKDGDIFIPVAHARDLMTGDKVKVWLDQRAQEVVKLETLQRSVKAFIGTFESTRHGHIAILADRLMRQEVDVVLAPKMEGVKTGDKVLVEITGYEPRPRGKVTRNFGPELAPKFDTFSVVVRAQWPQAYPEEVVKQAELIAVETHQREQSSG